MAGARAQQFDPLQSMRFHVNVTDGSSDWLGPPQAGFSAVTTPEATLELVDYREGQYTFTRRQPALPTMAEITLSRGVTTTNTNFFGWMNTAMRGGSYRADLQILQFHRAALTGQQVDINLPGRTYEIHEAVPVRHKVAGDLEATSSEVSVQELDVAYEWFDVKEGLPEPLANVAPAGPSGTGGKIIREVE